MIDTCAPFSVLQCPSAFKFVCSLSPETLVSTIFLSRSPHILFKPVVFDINTLIVWKGMSNCQ